MARDGKGKARNGNEAGRDSQGNVRLEGVGARDLRRRARVAFVAGRDGWRAVGRLGSAVATVGRTFRGWSRPVAHVTSALAGYACCRKMPGLKADGGP